MELIKISIALVTGDKIYFILVTDGNGSLFRPWVVVACRAVVNLHSAGQPANPEYPENKGKTIIFNLLP